MSCRPTFSLFGLANASTTSAAPRCGARSRLWSTVRSGQGVLVAWEGLFKDGPDPFAEDGQAPQSPKARKQKERDFLHEDMDEVVCALPAIGIVWVRLLQLRGMRRKEKYLLLGNAWLTRHGVDRWAKMRALRSLEKKGFIYVRRENHRNPRVVIIARPTPRRKSDAIVCQSDPQEKKLMNHKRRTKEKNKRSTVTGVRICNTTAVNSHHHCRELAPTSSEFATSRSQPRADALATQ